MGAPTAKEIELLSKFRDIIKDLELKDEQKGDMFLLRWIRARDNDLSKAEDMLRKSLKWREANHIDDISKWEAPNYFHQEFSFEFTGADDGGSPVLSCTLGLWDIRKIVEAGERDTYVRYVDQVYCELLAKLTEIEIIQQQKEQSQFVAIVDLKGMSIRQLASPSAVETALETFRRFEANFPETLKTAFIINAPRIFPMAFALVKPLLSGRTLRKVQIFNSNASKWKPALAAAFPIHTIPTEYGGTFVSLNSPHKNDTTSPTTIDEDGLIEVKIAAGGKLLLEFDVESINSILRWEFKTENHDIGFSITYGNHKEEVHCYERYNSHVKKAAGSLICQKTGTYSLVFDNSYSRLRAKTLRYLGTIISETDEERDENGNDSTSF